MPDEADFLARWSRRKAAARREEQVEPEAIATAPQPEPEPDPTPLPVEPPELPDPETLEAGSDFKAFMAENVPGDLRRQALRRLWRVNPIINSLDGLDDYYVTQNFTDAATVVPDLRTLYRVGKGMLDAAGRLEEMAAEAREPEPAPAPAGTPEEEPRAIETAGADETLLPMAEVSSRSPA
jgi:hypothetical protein